MIPTSIDDGTERSTCPRCGKESMVRKGSGPSGYYLVCTLCGLRRCPFPPDTGKGVV